MISRTVQSLLMQRPHYCAVVNRFAGVEATEYLKNQGCKPINGLPLTCFINNPPHVTLPPSPQTTDKLLYYYTLDIASLLPVLALSPQPDSNVLDLCAAPGGKAFALAQILSLQSQRCGGSLALNDPSHSCLVRLKDVIFTKCLPKSQRHSVRVTKRKGEDWGRTGESDYQCVLVDVPCSSDRHQITNWQQKDKMYPDSEELSNLQQKLLLAAMKSVTTGGVVVYSTCTLSELENDGVIHKTLKIGAEHNLQFKPDSDLAILKPLDSYLNYQQTYYGILVTPFESANCGPLYFCRLEQNN